jgi:aspartate 1-decarboxylase
MITKKRMHKSRWALVFPVLLILGLSACGGSGGSGSDDETTTTTTTATREINGGGVKGPLAFAIVTAYAFDSTKPGFKGDVIATATTNAAAQIVGLTLPEPLNPPYILEFTSDADTRDITTGMVPVIATMRTVLTQTLIDSGKSIYATPLTTMAVDIAIANALDTNGTEGIQADEFESALTVAAAQVVSTVGFGMSGDIDIFDTPPLVDSTTDSAEEQTDVAAYRSAVEALTAVVFQMEEQSAGGSVDAVLGELSLDLADGIIDGTVDSVPSTIFTSTTLDVLAQDPANLPIPNSTSGQTVADVQAILVSETTITQTTTSTTELDAGGSIDTAPKPAETNPDTDADGVLNADDAFPDDASESADTDGDGIGDNADPDADNDGVADGADAFPLNNKEHTDTDSDCAIITTQTTTSGDDCGDNSDPDIDGDGTDNAQDDFPFDATKQNKNDVDNDGWDTDADPNDNDAAVPVIAFVDTDGDGLADNGGNLEDGDDDNDGVVDGSDVFPLNSDESADTDSDCGEITTQTITSGDGCGDNTDTDIDGDGTDNAQDAFPFDATESKDTDSDGEGDNADLDADGDDWTDIEEGGTTQDTDADLTPDYLDLDSDNDGILDVNETDLTAVTTVTVINVAPVASNVSASTPEDVQASGALSATDANAGDTLTYSLITGSELNGTANITGSTFTFDPTGEFSGTASFQYRVTDGSATSNVATVAITVNAVNDLPTFTTTAITAATEDSAYSYTAAASDVDVGDSLTLSAPVLPSWLTFTPGTGELAGTPTNANVGDHNVTLRVNDGSVDVDQSFIITVVNTNDAPAFTTTAITAANEDSAYSYNADVSDIDPVPDSLTLSAPVLPSWLTFTPGSGELAGIPTNAEVGEHNVTLRVNDGSVNVDQSFTITVSNVNDASIFTTTAITAATEDSAYSYTAAASDVDVGDSLTLSAPTLPTWLGFNADTGELSGTPGNAEVGDHNVTLRVNDGSGNVDQSFIITVANTNDAPTFTTTAITAVTEDSAYSYTAAASDVDPVPDTLTLSAPVLPDWLNFDTGTGVLSGMPTNDEVGDHDVTLSVNDGSVDVEQSFTITVSNVNDASIFTTTAITAATEDSAYSYTAAASDVDPGPDTLTLSAPVLPGWLTFTPGTGELAGTPTNDEVGEHNVTLRVNDGSEDVDQIFVISVANTNDDPVAADDPVNVDVITPATINVLLNDSDVDVGDTLTIVSVTQGALGTVTFTASDVTYTNVSGTEGQTDSFTYTIDDGTVTAFATVNITLVANQPPTFTTTAITAASEDSAYSYTAAVTDEESDPLTLSAPVLPAWLSFDAGTGVLSGTPANANVGDNNVTLRVSDGVSNVDQSFTITVANTNDAPAFTTTAITAATEDSAYSYTAAASDVDPGPDTLTLSAPVLPGWLTFTPGTGVLAGTPTNAEVGEHNLTLRVNDGSVDVDQSFIITVANTNDAPAFTTTAITAANEDSAYSYTAAASDVDVGDSLTLSAPVLPGWLTFTPGSGELAGTPTNAEVGDHEVTLRVSDGVSNVDQSFTITVANTNDAPTFTTTAITAASEDSAYSYTAAASDVDVGDSLILSALVLPDWLTFTPGTGELAGTPTNDEVGDHNVTLRVNDGSVDVDQVFIITVANANDAPTFTSTAITAASEDSAYSHTVAVSDVDPGPDTLTLSAPVLPDWLTFTPGTGVLAGTPTNDEVGDHNVTLRVNDGSVDVDQSFIITVANANDAPTFTSTAITAASEDRAYSYTVAVSDVDPGPDTLTLSAPVLPDWLSFTPGTGELAGTPTNAEVGDHNVTLRVNDGSVDVDQVFIITVTNANDAPAFTSTAITAANEDGAYSYTAAASDVDVGDSLTLSAPVLPAWLTFTPGTGELSGTPTNAEVGDHDVTLRVSDGVSNVDQVFIITVANTNDAPTFTSTVITAANEDGAYSYTAAASDVDVGDSLTLSAPVLPAWLTFTPGSGELTGTPTNTEVGDHNVTLRVNDGSVDVDQSFIITVANTNDAPTFTTTAITAATEDSAYSYTAAASDVDPVPDTLTLSAPVLPGWLTFTPATGVLSGTPTNDEVGDHNVTLRVNDGSASVNQTFVISVTNTNDNPVAVDDSGLVIENTLFTTVNVLDNDIDVDGDLLSVTGNTDASNGVVVNKGDGTFDYTPNTDYLGPDSFDYSVDDGNGGTDTGTVNLSVNVLGTAVVSDLLDPDAGGGVGKLEGSEFEGESVHPILSYYKEQYIPDTNTYFEIGFEYNYDSQSFAIDTDNFDENFDHALKADGSWVREDQWELVVSTVNHGDGSMSISIIDSNDAEELGRLRVRAQTFDLDGQPMAGSLIEEWVMQLLDPAAVFGPGALAISSYTFEPEIDFYERETWIGCSESAQVNGDCNTVPIDEFDTLALTLDQMIVETAWVDPDDFTETGMKRVWMEYDGASDTTLFAELVSTGNTVNYYVRDYSSDNEGFITLVLSDVGGWERDSDVRNTDMIRFVIPLSVSALFPENGDFIGDRRRIYVEHDGAVRGEIYASLIGEIEPSDDGNLNGIAIDQVLDNFNPPPSPDFNKLVGTWVADLISSMGDRRLLHVFGGFREGYYEASGHCDQDGRTTMDYGLIYDSYPSMARQWNEETGEFMSFSFLNNGETDCGLHSYRGDTLLVDGDTLTHHIPDVGDIVYHRMQAASNPLIGSWITGDIEDQGEGHAILTFFDDTTFALSQNCDSEGLAGFEYGDYIWDQVNLSGTLSIDTNGSCGAVGDNSFAFSGLTMFLDGNTLTINDGFEGSNDVVYVRHSDPNLPCGFETEWNDALDEPAVFNSFDQFEGVLESCGGRLPLATVDLENSSWVDAYDDEGVAVVSTIIFNDNGTADITETRDGSLIFDVPDAIWSVSNNYVMVSSVLFGFHEVWAMTGAGLKAYSEAADWSSSPDLATLDDTLEGEIWTPQHVNSANIAPIGNPDFAMINEDTPVTTGNVLDNDTDLDSSPGPLSISGFDLESANGGTVTDNGDGSFDYSPAAHFNGNDTFTYTVSDGEAEGIGTVTITVWSVNDLPEIEQEGPLSVTIDEDSPTMVFEASTITAIDADNDGLTWSSPGAQKGDANVSGVGSSPIITYLADADANGADSFEVKVHDGNGGRDSIIVNVTITPVNDLPVITGTPQSFATDGVPYSFTPMGVDPDDQTKVYSIVKKPVWADFDTATGELSGTPALSDVGGDFSGIVISLTTGDDTVPLPGFTIVVNATTGVSAVWGPFEGAFDWDDGSTWQSPPVE